MLNKKAKLYTKLYLLKTLKIANDIIVIVTKGKFDVFVNNKIKIAVTILLLMALLNSYKDVSHAERVFSNNNDGPVQSTCYNQTNFETPAGAPASSPSTKPAQSEPASSIPNQQTSISANCYAPPPPGNIDIPDAKPTPKTSEVKTFTNKPSPATENLDIDPIAPRPDITNQNFRNWLISLLIGLLGGASFNFLRKKR